MKNKANFKERKVAIGKMIVIIGIFSIFPSTSFAQWNDCHFGKTNDSCVAPGECGRYTDSNNDKICDHSQTEKIDKTITSALDVQEISKSKDVQKNRYPLLATAIIISLLYSVTYVAAQKKIITLVIHKKIWNGVLTLSFLITSILSIMLIIRANYGNILTPPFDVLYWHVLTGIIMMIIATFHALWHWRYYKFFFKK